MAKNSQKRDDKKVDEKKLVEPKAEMPKAQVKVEKEEKALACDLPAKMHKFKK